MRALPFVVAGVAGLGALLFFSRRAHAAPISGAAPGPAESVEDIFFVSDTIYAQTVDGRQNEEKYRSAIQISEERHGIPAGLLHRQIYQESRFRSDIIEGRTVSAAGALGIAQIVPKYHPGVNALDPYAAIEYAADFMRRLYKQFGSWRLALAAYNAGPGNVQTYNGIPPFSETQRYVAEITADVDVA